MKTKLAIAVALALVSGAAWSADSGFYVGASVGFSDVSASASEKASDSEGNTASIKGDFNGSDFGWTVYVGYDFNKYAAVELGYIDLGNPNDTVDKGSDDLGGGDTVSYKTDVDLSLGGMDLAVVGKVPLGDSWDLHAKVGVVWWSPEVTWKHTDTYFTDGTVTDTYRVTYKDRGDSTDLLVGVGASWKLNENIIFGLDWTHIELGTVTSISDTGSDVVSVSPQIDTTDLYSVSATYKF
jgi:OOP family OmpA-OmpF porin